MQALSERTPHPDFRPWYRNPALVPDCHSGAHHHCLWGHLWLALANPDYLVVDDDQYQASRLIFTQPQPSSEPDREAPDGDR
jgi:hypothetical protein